jgi:biotin operon repressor
MDAEGKELTKKVGYGRTSVAKYIESLKKSIK